MDNYGSQDLSATITQEPFVRCNAPIPNVPKNHAVTIDDVIEKVKWDVVALQRCKIIYQIVCIECAGNSRNRLPYQTEGLQWDNCAVSNTIWGGVLLREVLHRVPSWTKEIVFTSLDKEFIRSLPIEVIYERQVMLATTMNYKPLTPEHGAPIRLIVPGWYGMASVKWLDRIYFVDQPFEGKYQTDKYTYKTTNKVPVTVILPKSLIISATIQNPVVIKGKAWSGYDIEKVELSIDDTWTDVDTKQCNGWVLWEKKVVLPPGKHKIASRATDISGATQPEKYSYNEYGYGNNAIQVIELSI